MLPDELGTGMRRRDFITFLGGAAMAWPVAGRAQQAERVRRVGVLMNLAQDDPESIARLKAFSQTLGELGWTEGRNIRIEYRFGAGGLARMRTSAAELVALAPDVILASAIPSVLALSQATSSVPIVFANVIDPVGSGFVSSLARPGGNATGFSVFEFGISEKWLGLLKQVAPGVTRVAVLRDTASPTGTGHFGAIQSAARLLNVELAPIGVLDAGEIERGITAFSSATNSGLIVTPSTSAFGNRDLIIKLAERHRLPAAYPFRLFATGGGLLSYGPNSTESFHRAAQYVDRILKGEKPADLPVQASTKYDLSINLKTAKSLGLTVPTSLLATADEVIE
jgi:putative tryptophan/tyrosine transport system substrate-binding protein